MSKMSKPVCAICKIKFTKMEILSKHMISVHKETPHTRMTRLTEAAKVELKKEPIEKPSNPKYLTVVNVAASSNARQDLKSILAANTR